MGKDLTKVQHVVFICNGNTCLSKGSEETTNQIRNGITARDIHDQIHTIKTRCTGQCEHGLIVFVYPRGVWYKNMLPPLSEALVQQHLVNDQLLEAQVFFPS